MSLVSYAASDSSGASDDDSRPVAALHAVNSAPQVSDYARDARTQFSSAIDPKSRELSFNPKFEDLFAPQFGPENPFKDASAARRNFLTGSVEEAHVSAAQFELQRKNFHAYGLAANPSDGATGHVANHVAATCSQPRNKRKKVANADPSDVDGYTGPWAHFEDESRSARPSPEEQMEIEALLAKKKRGGQKTAEEEAGERATVHIEDVYDYQGRSFLHAPQDLDVSLRADHVPAKCFLPKKLIHTYTGHSKALTAIRWFPRSAHLFLSSSMDAKIKLWEVYKDRRCVITYLGHKQAVRDISFNRSGNKEEVV